MTQDDDNMHNQRFQSGVTQWMKHCQGSVHLCVQCIRVSMSLALSLRRPLHADITIHVGIKSKDNSLWKEVTMGWKNDKSQGMPHHIVLRVHSGRWLCFWRLPFRTLTSAAVHRPFCLKQTPVTDIDCDTCQLTQRRSSAADERVAEVVMFQTIRLPVLIGLSAAVICSRLLFVMMYAAPCVLLWQWTTYKALKNRVKLLCSKLCIWFIQ